MTDPDPHILQQVYASVNLKVWRHVIADIDKPATYYTDRQSGVGTHLVDVLVAVPRPGAAEELEQLIEQRVAVITRDGRGQVLGASGQHQLGQAQQVRRVV